jgi:hypothetical protein
MAKKKKRQLHRSANAEMHDVLRQRQEEAEENFLQRCMQSTVDLSRIAYGRVGYTVVVPLHRRFDDAKGSVIIEVISEEGVVGVGVYDSDFAPLPSMPAAWLAVWTLYEDQFPADAIDEQWRPYLHELWVALKWACDEVLQEAMVKCGGVPNRVRREAPSRRTNAMRRPQVLEQRTLH